MTTIRRIIQFAEHFQRGMTGLNVLLIYGFGIDIFDEEGAVELTGVQGEICFDNVSFEYPDDHNKVLQTLVWYHIRWKGCALVGPSGGGKTTLCIWFRDFTMPQAVRF